MAVAPVGYFDLQGSAVASFPNTSVWQGMVVVPQPNEMGQGPHMDTVATGVSGGEWLCYPVKWARYFTWTLLQHGKEYL